MRFERFDDPFGGTSFVMAEFGMLVQIASQRDGLRGEFGGERSDGLMVDQHGTF